MVSYLESPLECIQRNPSNIYYLLNTSICMISFGTYVTQFYALRMIRCDNIFYLLYCKRERKYLQLKSVSSPIEMKTLSDTDFFLCVFFSLKTDQNDKNPSFVNAYFLSPNLVQIAPSEGLYLTTSSSGMISYMSFPRMDK